MVSRELFARHVKDALASLYDSMHLQVHPLAHLLVAQGAEGAGQALRRILLDAIESLRPAGSIAYGRPEWLGYRLACLRYVEARNLDEMTKELALSRSAYYRHHQVALNAIVSVLWERYQRSQPTVEATQAAAEQAQEDALRAALGAQRQVISMQTIVEKVGQTILPLAVQEGVELQCDAPAGLPLFHGDPALLRQLLLNLLAAALPLAVESILRLRVSVDEGDLRFRLCGLCCTFEAISSVPEAISHTLLQLCDGRLQLERDESGFPVLALALPLTRPKTILIIDDDGDTVTLYRRFLQEQHYALFEARSGDQAAQVLAEVRPDLVLLDVLMPQEDGWDILQRLKTSPATAPVPVVICSVLTQPRLALALGAATVLQKPVDQATLVHTVQRLLNSANAWDPEHPA